MALLIPASKWILYHTAWCLASAMSTYEVWVLSSVSLLCPVRERLSAGHPVQTASGSVCDPQMAVLISSKKYTAVKIIIIVYHPPPHTWKLNPPKSLYNGTNYELFKMN